jgi:class 3 adenylate cyclase/tetratricopeptide (TPR) repeat protein
MRICANCGEENPDKFRLCGFCGTPFEEALPPQETRKTVTIVFSDLKGSTSLGESLDSEALRAVMTEYFDAMRTVLERHGGRIEKFIGDAVMAVFGLPRLHEDDALRAVRAAADMQAALEHLNARLEERWGITLENRTGVNTGEVVAGDSAADQRLITGDAVNVAARLEQAAPAQQVLLGELTYRLVADQVAVEPVEPLELKGKSERVNAYRLVAVLQDAGVRTGGQLTPMVGRDEEHAQLLALFDAAVGDRRPRLVTLLGEAGVGKSRLTAEFLATVDAHARVLSGRCLSYGDGITFWPMADAIRAAADIDEHDTPHEARAKVAALGGDEEVARRLQVIVGLSTATFAIEELFWGMRRLLETLAADRPLVLVVNDVHWAEPTLLDLVEHLAEQVSGPVLILCPARAELLDERPSWGEPATATTIQLAPLGEDAVRQIVGRLADAGVPDDTLARVVEAADGNPLFAEQMVAMIGDAPDAPVEVPPTIQALMSARLDRISREERAVIEPASVVGQVFAHAMVEELAPPAVSPHVELHLSALAGKRFVLPLPATADEDRSSRFQHILIRDAAYQGLLKRARADLHERFVAWADRVNRDRGAEYEEILGYHLEQAYRYLDELGPLDGHGYDVGIRAATRLASAGRRAFARGDMPAAANLLRRAADLLPTFDDFRVEMLTDLGEALLDVGEFAEAERVLAEAMSAAEEMGDERLAADAGLVLTLVRMYSGAAAWGEGALAEAHRAIPVLEEHGDEAGLAKAWRVIGAVHGVACRYGEAAPAVERAIEHARAAGDVRQERRNSAAYALAALYGPTPVDDAIGRCEQIVAESAGDRRSEGLALCALGQLEAMRGDFDRARGRVSRAREMLNDLGGNVLAASTCIDAAEVEFLAGDPVAAERRLRDDQPVLEAMGAGYLLSTVCALLAQALCEQGRLDEAEASLAVTRELADDDDIESQAYLRRIGAEIAVARGQGQAAAAMAADARDVLRDADAPVLLADASVTLARALIATGDEDAARAALDDAIRAYDEKGDSVDARKARELRSSSAVA